MEQSQNQNNTDTREVKAAPTPNVWIVTLPFFSHVVCASRLAKHIAGHGLSVTLLGAKDEIQRLQTLPDQRLQGFDIHLRSVDIASTALAGSVGELPKVLQPGRQLEQAFEEILKNELNKKSKPSYVIVDFFLPGALDVALHYKIPACHLITFSAGYTAANIYIKRLALKSIMALPDSILDMDKEVQQEVISLPGLPLIRICDLNGMNFKENPLYAVGWQNAETVQKAEVLLLSGFRDLEPRAHEELERMLKINGTGHGKKKSHIWPIGPLFDLPSSKDSTSIQTEDVEVDTCIKFLDLQSPSSVVYVAFRTDVSLSQEQIRELAYGLQSSQHPFLCVLHPPRTASKSEAQVQDIFSVIPADCLACTGNKGMFVMWAPQMEVLSHPSTGAFISHCGYNSVLESVCLGVPIIAWPLQYDQFMNCRQLVDEAKIALEVCPGLVPGRLVDRKNVERSVTTLFNSEEGTAVRNRVLQMKQRAEASVGINGSSTNNMHSFVALIQRSSENNLETPDPELL